WSAINAGMLYIAHTICAWKTIEPWWTPPTDLDEAQWQCLHYAIQNDCICEACESLFSPNADQVEGKALLAFAIRELAKESRLQFPAGSVQDESDVRDALRWLLPFALLIRVFRVEDL